MIFATPCLIEIEVVPASIFILGNRIKEQKIGFYCWWWNQQENGQYSFMGVLSVAAPMRWRCRLATSER